MRADVARLDAGRLELWRDEMDLVGLVLSVAEHTRATAPGHAIRVEAPECLPTGWWDRDRLGQVLENLLSNAVKYSPEGSEVVVRVEDRGHAALVAVRDAGLGLAPEALPRLFDRFYRAGTTRDGVRGLGLGLHIARSLVEAHGGRIWAASDGPGSGCTFTVDLPYGQVPRDEVG